MRRCKVTTIGLKEPIEGYFHQWVTVDELRVSTRVKDAGNVTPVRVVRAVVEFDDGSVGLIKVDQIKFVKDKEESGGITIDSTGIYAGAWGGGKR